MPHSKGYRCKTRHVLKKKGERGLSRLMYPYKVGDRVVIDIDPSQHKGMPHRRYQGRVGIVEEVRRRSLVVAIKVGGKVEKPIVRLEHVRPFGVGG